MQIYLEGCALYGFNRQKTFGAGYMAENPASSQEHQRHDESNVEHKANLSVKSWQEVKLLIVSHR